MDFQVVEYQQNAGQLSFVAVVAGMGKNRGTWDTSHSRTAAYRHCKKLRAKYPDPNRRFFVESVH